jgi:hypothetical protein
MKWEKIKIIFTTKGHKLHNKKSLHKINICAHAAVEHTLYMYPG